MATRRFTMAHGPAGRRYWLDVVVYDTAAELSRAVVAYMPSFDPDALACFQFRHNPKGRHLGVLRFAVEHLDPGVVVHEAVHAAVAYVRRSGRKRIVLDTSYPTGRMIDTEESLAYAVQGMSTALLQALALVTT